MILMLSPLLVLVAIGIKVSSPGPVIFRQKRIGYKKKSFIIFKFRTMVQTDIKSFSPQTTAANDPRITKLGRILRIMKLDELPQLFNVMLGQMSFVGPRPNVELFTDNYHGEEEKVFEVPQGVTDFSSLWFREQEVLLVSLGTGDAEKDYLTFVDGDKKRLQLVYVREISFVTDIKIFVATILAIFFKISPIWCIPPNDREPLVKL